jgi:hypothetical protein
MPRQRHRNVEVQLRDAYALQLRRQGFTYDQIAEQLARRLADEAAATGAQPPGYTSMSAHRAVKRALQDAYREDVADAQRLELERLDELLRQTARIAVSRHYVVSNAGHVVIGPDGQPLEDPGPRLAAISLMKSISESRRKLLGLDAPQRRVIEVITEDTIDGMIASMREDVAVERAQQTAIAGEIVRD